MKKILLSLIVFAFTGLQSFAQLSISTKKVLNGPFCAGTSTTVGYIVSGAFNPGNVFTAELSDKDGNFTSPTVIGSIAKTTSGNISCTLPAGLPSSNKYRVRVVGSNPAVTGSQAQNKVAINPKPNGLSVTGLTACSATLNWAASSTAASYKVQYRVTGSGTWSSTYDAGTATSYTFNELNSSTSYDFQVRNQCANGEKSDWAKITASTTTCQAPGSFIVTDIGLTTSALDWANTTCATGYLFQYRAFGDPDWISLTSPTSNINLTGLFAATLYEAQVATDCGANNSAWSSSIIWETKYFKVAGDAGMEASFRVFPNPSSGVFTVNYNSSIENAQVNINVQNMYGQVIYETQLKSVAGINEVQIALNEAPAGLYFVSIKTDSKEFKTSLMIH
ncbi:MAG: fibronectin type III domain-containing protein [Chitinophagales bacterium]|nr:fibronectin type III domain-containing protein [Chitinophagales bacterium]